MYGQYVNLEIESEEAYLVDKGIDADRISVESKGELEPIADNHIIEDRKLNRRISFVINE